MAVTTLTYSGNGSLADFALTFDYTTTAAIEVYVDAVLQVASTDYIFTTPTNIQFQPGAIPPSGTNNIEFRRNTPTAPLVDFTAGAAIQDTDLDLFVNQTLHVLEELENESVNALTRVGANWDAESDRITNVAPPIADTDVATQASIASQVAAANASEALAESWANVADGHAQDAASSFVSANGAASAAATSAFNAANSAASVNAVYPVTSMTIGRLLSPSAFNVVSQVRVRYPVFVTEGTITDDLVLDLELAGGFDEYLLEIREYRPDTNNTKLQLRFSDDDAVTYESGAIYDYVVAGNDAGAGTGDEDGNGQTEIVLATKQGTTAPEYCDIDLNIFRGSTTVYPRVRGTGITLDHDSDTSLLTMGGQHRALPSATGITHIRLFSSGGGRLLSGNYTLWGINKS